MIHTTKQSLIFIIFLFLAGCAGAGSPASPDPLPTPQSTLVGEFMWQQDGKYGFAMLRPAGWQASDSGIATVYAPAPQPEEGRLALSAVGYEVSLAPQNGEDVHAKLFRENPSLDAWAGAVNQTLWKDSAVQLETELAQARIYSIRSTGGHIRFIAYIIDQRQPLVVTLEGGGGLADAARLRGLGVLDDFAVMVDSARAAAR